MVTDVQYEHWSSFLYREGAICSPAEFQGYICGILCAGIRLEKNEWLKRAYEFMDLIEAQENTEAEVGITAFYEISLQALRDDSLNFQLLLPDDATPLNMRTQALGQWANGFLNGFGLSGDSNASKLDEQSRELLKDFASISQIEPPEQENEDSEKQYAEVIEYIRMGVFSLFSLLVPDSEKPSNKAAASPTKH